MTRAKISEYSATANDNTDVNGINIAEGCPPSSMNNMGREIMAALKRFQVGSDGDGVTVGGQLAVTGTTTTSPAIVAAGDTNTGIFFPAADTIAFAEGGAEAMRIDSSGNVGVGTTSPSSYFSGATNLVVGNASGNTGMTISSGNASLGRILFADGTSGAEAYQGWVYYTHADNALSFATAGAERARITSDGYLRMASGTGGIQFNGDTAAANALDDYEEGTFDPTVVGTSSAGTVTYVTRVGRYTKIGNRVFYQFTVIWNSGTGTGNLRVTGLPFTNASGSGFNPPQTIAIQNITLTANHYVVGDCPQGQSRIDVYSQPTGGGATADVTYDAVGDIYCAGHYFVA